MSATSRNGEDERGSRKGLVILACFLGVLLSGVLVLTTSRAAFSAQTDNTTNSVGAGDVTLTDDDSSSAMFTVSNMAPDDAAVVECIEVTYSGTIADPGEVRLFSGGFTDSGSLADELDITVDVGTGGSFGDCTGFSSTSTVFSTDTLTAFDTAHNDYSTGAVGWDPSSTPESRTFRFTVDLPTGASNSVQGDSVTDLTFTWEVQS
jgi:hypothetical protein